VSSSFYTEPDRRDGSQPGSRPIQSDGITAPVHSGIDGKSGLSRPNADPFTFRAGAGAGAIASVAQLAGARLRVYMVGRRGSTRSRALRRGCAAGWR
jgi:hypothetical protein